MRRQFHTVRRYDLEGSDKSERLAAALAQKCDPETLEKLLEVICLLHVVGGQVYIAAYRTKYGPDGVPLEDVRQPGRYETDGFVFHYEHMAKLNRQAEEPDVKPEETPAGLPAAPAISDEEIAQLERELLAEVKAEAEAEVAADEATAGTPEGK